MNDFKEAMPRTCHECLPGEPKDNGVLARPREQSWSTRVKHKEDLRGLMGCVVEVLAIYGRKRRFLIGVNDAGELVERTPDCPEGISMESEFATVKVVFPTEGGGLP